MCAGCVYHATVVFGEGYWDPSWRFCRVVSVGTNTFLSSLEWLLERELHLLENTIRKCCGMAAGVKMRMHGNTAWTGVRSYPGMYASGLGGIDQGMTLEGVQMRRALGGWQLVPLTVVGSVACGYGHGSHVAIPSV
jgi:hypothetical protein